MNKRVLDYDPLTRTTTYHAYDDATKTTWIEEVQDVEPYIERNKRTQAHDVGGAMGMNDYFRQGVKNGWAHVATIPNGVIHKWLVEKGVNLYNKDHWPKVRKLLNDPDWRYVRTGLGRV